MPIRLCLLLCISCLLYPLCCIVLQEVRKAEGRKKHEGQKERAYGKSLRDSLGLYLAMSQSMMNLLGDIAVSAFPSIASQK